MTPSEEYNYLLDLIRWLLATRLFDNPENSPQILSDYIHGRLKHSF